MNNTVKHTHCSMCGDYRLTLSELRQIKNSWEDMRLVLIDVAAHFKDTDAPLGTAARAALRLAEKVGHS